MMKVFNKREAMKSYILSANLLPERLWRAAFILPEDDRICAEEFRLRAGRPFSVVADGKQRDIYSNGHPVITYDEDIENVLAKATECSLHSWESQIRQGFITVKGGNRIGLCGHIAEGERGATITQITSIDIRIAKQMIGAANGLAERVMRGGFEDTLIVSPPGVGKTTLLRDMCRVLSRYYRVSVADSRYEIGGSISGETVFDLGGCDVMQGGNKGQVISMLLRAMSPEIIAVDEITSKEDVKAILEASYTGCSFLATAHGDSLERMYRRPLYKAMLDSGMFKKIIFLERLGSQRICRIYERDDEGAENNWRGDDNYIMLGDGDIAEPGYEKEAAGAERAYRGSSADKIGDFV